MFRISVSHYVFPCIVVASTLLTGCKIETSAELYFSDVLSVIETGKAEQASINYLIEMPTADKCKLYGQQIADLFKPEMIEFTKVECQQRNFDNLLSLTGRVQIVRGISDADGGHVLNFSYLGLSAIGVYKDGDAIDVFVTLSRSVFDRLTAQAKKAMDQSLSDLELSQITLTINNDTKTDVSIFVRAGFIEGEPILNDSRVLKGHSKSQIIASNVHEKALAKNGYVPVFVVLQ